MFPQNVTTTNALATFVLFLIASLGWYLGARIVGMIPPRKAP